MSVRMLYLSCMKIKALHLSCEKYERFCVIPVNEFKTFYLIYSTTSIFLCPESLVGIDEFNVATFERK